MHCANSVLLTVLLTCTANPQHKQRQGYHTEAAGALQVQPGACCQSRYASSFAASCSQALKALLLRPQLPEACVLQAGN